MTTHDDPLADPARAPQLTPDGLPLHADREINTEARHALEASSEMLHSDLEAVNTVAGALSRQGVPILRIAISAPIGRRLLPEIEIPAVYMRQVCAHAATADQVDGPDGWVEGPLGKSWLYYVTAAAGKQTVIVKAHTPTPPRGMA